MRKFIVAIALSMLTAFTYAATLESELSWDAPTERVNGKALDVNEISHYVISVSSPTLEQDQLVEVESPNTNYTHSLELPIQTDPISVEYRVRTVDTFGLESKWSDPAIVSGVIAPDSAPASVETLMHVENCTNCTLIIERAGTTN